MTDISMQIFSRIKTIKLYDFVKKKKKNMNFTNFNGTETETEN